MTNWRPVSPFVGKFSHQINEKSLVDLKGALLVTVDINS